ncbi:site-2 protease family protein [Pontiellaceae bacterium B12227]|nr:site-2 protease family protein [Pontiellaceae bacterium B12227]
MENNALLLGSVFGIPIKVSMTLLILMPLLALRYGAENLGFGLIIVVGLFASVALHELGHALVAIKFGGHVKDIELGILGGVARVSNMPSLPRQEILIALAGPAVSLVLGLIGVFSRVHPLLFYIGAINLMLFGFNILPCFPMDGGRVLRAALATKKNKLEATRLATTIGKYFCILFVVYGLLNFNLILALIGGYIYMAGQQELRMVSMEYQANRFSGFSRDDNIDVEVSPPPYARGGHSSADSIVERLKKFFSDKK